MTIVKGTVLQHTQDPTWFARVDKIDEEANKIEMFLSSEEGGDGWFETWNLEHTQVGLRRGEYKVIGKCAD